MSTYEEAYRRLNPAQKRAVDTVYGPLLVIAGPGTGKTQLLTARVANILKVTDALPQNILCLTFTESGAYAMRERLRSFIGQPAYDVSINTYHAFGSAILNRYPEYFTDLRLERPVDELGKYQILAEVLAETAYTSPIKQLRHHIGDLIATISEVKRGLLSPDDLRTIAKTNLHTIETTKHAIGEALHAYTNRLPSKLDQSLPLFESILAALQTDSTQAKAGFPAYGDLAGLELTAAIEAATEIGKTKPLTAWKNSWLVKDDQNEYMLAGSLEARRMTALADVLERYEERLAAEGMYDFDDMILRAVDILTNNDDLRFSLQEQYQFILLDEFQDTNAAQLRLVELLTNNPVSEGRPNVMAVGDDDQAIYAFQGAEVSNMLDFYRMYEAVEVISLQENYRSTAEILETASNLATQIESRLHSHFPDIEKQLVAQSTGKTQLARRSFTSAIAERTAVADQIV
ncbi:ATP-dependent helicase, partial [Candidatus Saccharibacteria bacterium]|nr:ATP-dependent helicase [Candidatus Saccharibacteria bacterium]